MLSKTIGLKLFELTKQKSWSQEQTADYLCISRSAYQRIETGGGFSWANNLEKYVKFLKFNQKICLKMQTLL